MCDQVFSEPKFVLLHDMLLHLKLALPDQDIDVLDGLAVLL